MAEPQMSQKGPQNYGSIPSDSSLPTYYVTPAPPPRRSITNSRFFQAFMLALALLELTWLSRHVFWHRHRYYPHSPWEVDMAGIDHGAEGCAVWDHYDPNNSHHHLNTNATTDLPVSTFPKLRGAGDKSSFSIPTSSSRYHFTSWGPIDKSRFEVIPVKSDKDQIVVEVEIVKDPRGVARVCALPSTGDDETYGVGIYVPRLEQPHHDRDYPAFNVLVYVPISSDGRQRTLHSFETRLGQFEHVFPDLSQHINFERLDLSAANVPMGFKSVVASSIKVANANGPISGTFTSASDLILTNANSQILGELTLTHSGNIKISNANSPIDVQIHLKSGDFHPRPSYTLSTSNANSPITLSVLSQPLNSALTLHASNAMAPIKAALSAAFEGAFKLSTVFATAEVVVKNEKDPSGEGRERVVRYSEKGRSAARGTVGWGGKDEKGEHAVGDVTLSSAGSHVELILN